MSALWLHAAAEPYGRLVRARQAGDFVLRLSKYQPSAELPMHRHPAAYFCFVVRGAMDERVVSSRRLFDGGSLHFHPEGESHATYVGSQGITCLSIVPKGELASRTRMEAPNLEARPVAHLARRCYDAFCDSDDVSDLVLEAAALELLAGTLRHPHAALTPLWIHKIRDYMHAHYAEKITLAELAAIAGVHRVHVVRAFRQHLGETPGSYVRRLRIEAARTALLESPASIAEIALDAGFSSQAQFTRHFHREIGLPPAAYRRLHLQHV